MSLDEGSQAQSRSTSAVSASSILTENTSVSAAVSSSNHLIGATTTAATGAALGASMDVETPEARTTGSTHMQQQLDTSHLLQASLSSLGSNTAAADAASQPVLSAVPSPSASDIKNSDGARMANPSTSTIVSPSFIISDAAPTSIPTTSGLSQQQTKNSQTQIPGSDSILMLNSSNTASVCTSAPSMASISSNADPSSQQQQQQLLHESILAQQAAFVAAMNSTTQLSIATAAQNNQHTLEKQVAVLPLQTVPVSHTNHSRSTSVVDGMVAMFPNDTSNTVTPRSGVMVVPSIAGSSTQPMAAQIQLQLQLHQQQLEQQLAIGQTAASNASTLASANHSGVQSPFATPSGSCAAGTMVSGHRRQLSSTVPGALHQQQQQQQLVVTETPTSQSTAPPTLVPGTPTTFGQLQFPSVQPTNGVSAHSSHHHHSHLGHSRHLSLDNANFRLTSGDASAALHALPLHGTIHEHLAGVPQEVQNRAASNAFLALQQQQHQAQQIQQQLFQQQLQAQAHALSQQKAVPLTTRTVPITPQTPMASSSAAGAFQASSLADSLMQHQQHSHHHRGAFMHHSSASVDLGALSSAFNVAQLSHTLSGQISPVGVQSTMASTMGVSQTQHLPHQYGIGVQPQDLIQPGLLHRNSVDMTGADNAVDDDEGDDEENSSEDTDKEAKGARKGSSNSGAVKCSTGKIKRPEAPYKRFRNSFIFFANERRKQWRREHPEVTKIQNRGFIQEMSKVWNSMSAEEKTPYMKMAEDDKLRYEADVKKYGPLPTNAQSASASSSGTGTTASTTPTALSMAQASSSVTASSLRGSEAGSVSLQASVPSVVPIAPAPAESAVSTPTAAPANNAIDVSVGSASINNAYANSNAAAVAAAAAAIAQPTPIAPAFIGSSHHLPVESFGVDSAVLGQHSYQMMLQQTFGQDFSPQAVEFDPSCFVGPDVQSADASTICFNPFSAAPTVNAESRQQHLQQLPAVSYDNSGTMIATGGASVPDTLSSNSNDGGTDASGSSSKAASANGPPITTLVGTKRKSSSDGQPMTSLPMSVKRFRNSFIYFVNARRQEMQFSRNGTPTNVEVNNREFLKEMSGKWRMMSEEEKAPYLKMADADKERFTREMREYELEHPEEFSKQSRHRRRRSSATSNGISAGIAGLDAMSAESSKLQSAAVAASMPFMPPSTAAYGLNISLTGIANSGSASPNGLLPFAQNAAGAFNSALALSSVPAEVMAHELNRAVATSVNTPISTAVSTPLTTPLLTPNAASLSDKTEMAQLSTGHFPSLPSVPEEVAVCTDAANSIAVASNVGVAGSTAGYLATAAKVATLPTVLEGADEDVNMN